MDDELFADFDNWWASADEDACPDSSRGTALLAWKAAIAVVRAHDRDGERWRQLVKLATQWPQTVLVVNINIGHDWHTADTPKQIQDVVDAAMRAEG